MVVDPKNCLIGVSAMQPLPDMIGLLERHEGRKVAGGVFEGKLFKDLDLSNLRKAARRYPADPKLQKFAKAKLAIHEIDNSQEPFPCAPLRIANGESETKMETKGSNIFTVVRSCCVAAWKYTWARYVIIASCLLILFKPPISTLMTRYVVRWLRLCLRRIVEILAMIVEGMMDEMIYQLDKALKGTLPQDMKLDELPSVALHLLSNGVSALIGAGVSLLSSYLYARRAQVG